LPRALLLLLARLLLALLNWAMLCPFDTSDTSALFALAPWNAAGIRAAAMAVAPTAIRAVRRVRVV
jgi:hypothetical protein